MARSPLFRQVQQALARAMSDPLPRVSSRAADRSVAAHDPDALSRRRFLGRAGASAAALLAAPPLARAGKPRTRPRIAIVGAGLAGLDCADRLEEKGYAATIYEASPTLGGRCSSIRGVFPGQTAEAGGEFIDTGHKTMIALARRFDLVRDDITKKVGDAAYHFFGQNHHEEAVVDEFRAVVSRFQDDARQLSNAPSAFDHNDADIALDNTDLATYFASRTAGFPLVEAVLNEAYSAEYGLATSQQSALNFLLFMRLNKRSRFEPFGISDERYHLRDGNDGIINGLAGALQGPILTNMPLLALRRNAADEFELFFAGLAIPARADAVVLAIPFTTLRHVALDPSLDLPSAQQSAIQTIGYGTNAKTMVGFDARVWDTVHGSSGTSYADLPDVQTTWETNASRAGPTAILTDYASSERGRLLDQRDLQLQVDAFLTDLDIIFPGTRATATIVDGAFRAVRAHWPSDPRVLGSYTCYLPGQFTTIEGWTGLASGPLKFAGEHSDSFYSYQGYMEGACLSGLRAADEILADIKAGRL